VQNRCAGKRPHAAGERCLNAHDCASGWQRCSKQPQGTEVQLTGESW
jgi:hypothetical protein